MRTPSPHRHILWPTSEHSSQRGDSRRPTGQAHHALAGNEVTSVDRKILEALTTEAWAGMSKSRQVRLLLVVD